MCHYDTDIRNGLAKRYMQKALRLHNSKVIVMNSLLRFSKSVKFTRKVNLLTSEKKYTYIYKKKTCEYISIYHCLSIQHNALFSARNIKLILYFQLYVTNKSIFQE